MTESRTFKAITISKIFAEKLYQNSLQEYSCCCRFIYFFIPSQWNTLKNTFQTASQMACRQRQ